MNIYDQKDHWVWVMYILAVIAMACTFAPFVFEQVDLEAKIQNAELDKNLDREYRVEIMKAHGGEHD